MILTREDRMNLGTATKEDVLGAALAENATSADADNKWNAAREEATCLLSARSLSVVLSDAAKRLCHGKKVEVRLERLATFTNELATFGRAHRFDDYSVEDPLTGLEDIPDILNALARTRPHDFKENPRQAKRVALDVASHFGFARVSENARVEEAFEDFFQNEFEARRQDFLLTIFGRCRMYEAAAAIRLNVLYARLRWYAELAFERARAYDNEAEKNKALGRADDEAEARRRAEDERAEAQSALQVERDGRAKAEGERDVWQKVAEGKLDGLSDKVDRVQETAEQSVGILSRLWEWLKSLKGWPGRKKRSGKKGGKPPYPLDMLKEAHERMENAGYGDKQVIAREVLDKWYKAREWHKNSNDTKAVQNFMRAIEQHYPPQKRD